jgi:hypothetical protein
MSLVPLEFDDENVIAAELKLGIQSCVSAWSRIPREYSLSTAVVVLVLITQTKETWVTIR